MINTAQKAELPAIKGNNIVISTTGDDYLEFTVGKEVSLIKRKDLYGLVFVLGDAATQDALMPVRKTQIRKYYKQHTITAKKDIKKGESIIANCTIDVPITVEEGLAGLVGRKKSWFAIGS